MKVTEREMNNLDKGRHWIIH